MNNNQEWNKWTAECTLKANYFLGEIYLFFFWGWGYIDWPIYILCSLKLSLHIYNLLFFPGVITFVFLFLCFSWNLQLMFNFISIRMFLITELNIIKHFSKLFLYSSWPSYFRECLFLLLFSSSIYKICFLFKFLFLWLFHSSIHRSSTSEWLVSIHWKFHLSEIWHLRFLSNLLLKMELSITSKPNIQASILQSVTFCEREKHKRRTYLASKHKT